MQSSQKKTIVIAGGAGFVGSHLADFLIGQGNEIVVLDNLSTGNKKNTEHLLKHKNFRFISGDATEKITDNFYAIKNFRNDKLRINEIYHLASPASPPHYQRDAIATWKANTIGTLNLLELAKKHKAKFLFASTSEIYGDPLVHPQHEKYNGNVNPVGIRSCYDESKRAGESLCMDFYRQHKVDVKIVRIFNTYGPRMDKNDGRVVSNFIVQALNNRPLTVYGSGKQTRSFQYVDDLILGLVKTMASKITGPVNIGNPEEFTVKQLAEKVIAMTTSSSRLVYKPLPKDDPKQRKPDISYAKKVLKWEPKVKLEQGLLKTIEYFKNL